jgi:hypothetical protein
MVNPNGLYVLHSMTINDGIYQHGKRTGRPLAASANKSVEKKELCEENLTRKENHHLAKFSVIVMGHLSLSCGYAPLPRQNKKYRMGVTIRGGKPFSLTLVTD